jgi:hypothetical protein
MPKGNTMTTAKTAFGSVKAYTSHIASCSHRNETEYNSASALRGCTLHAGERRRHAGHVALEMSEHRLFPLREIEKATITGGLFVHPSLTFRGLSNPETLFYFLDTCILYHGTWSARDLPAYNRRAFGGARST